MAILPSHSLSLIWSTRSGNSCPLIFKRLLYCSAFAMTSSLAIIFKGIEHCYAPNTSTVSSSFVLDIFKPLFCRKSFNSGTFQCLECWDKRIIPALCWAPFYFWVLSQSITSVWHGTTISLNHTSSWSVRGVLWMVYSMKHLGHECILYSPWGQ